MLDETWKQLKKHKKKTITKEELEHLFSVTRDDLLFAKIAQLEEEGLLHPVPTSKTNGNIRYPIYLKYKITFPEESFDAEQKEIETLHPLLQEGGYLRQKPAEYRKYRLQMQDLSRYLFQQEKNVIPISRKERSFEIFAEEKQLDDTTFYRLLEKLGLNQETLYFYDTPEYCFNDFIPERKASMTLLICENKDIWFNIRRMLFEEKASQLFGTHIDGVVCGWGNKVSQKDALTNYTAFMGGSDVTYLYWGDIDRAGFNIYLSLIKNNPSIKVKLFFPAYEEMLRLAKGSRIPNSKDKREICNDYSEIYATISEDCRTFLKEKIDQNERIPQEIVSYAYLRKVMR